MNVLVFSMLSDINQILHSSMDNLNLTKLDTSKLNLELLKQVLLEYSLLEMYKIKNTGKLLPLQEVDVWRHSKLRNIFKNSTKKKKIL